LVFSFLFLPPAFHNKPVAVGVRRDTMSRMDETEFERHEPEPNGRFSRGSRSAWHLIERLFDVLVDALVDYARIIGREFALFAGVAFVLTGLLNFQNGKNCDGNTADYLSCTNPSTFYYYSWFETTLIIIGVFLLILWYFKLKERHMSR